MVECDHCYNEIDEGVLPHKCSRCGQIHCSKHLQLEAHNCLGLEKYKEKNQERWINALKNIKFSKKDLDYSDDWENEPLRQPKIKKQQHSKRNFRESKKKSRDKKTEFSDKIKDYFIEIYENSIYWLRKREYHGYGYGKRFNYLLITILIFIASIVGFNIFYSNIQELNEMDFGFIKLGGVLILTSLFFVIKYGLRLIKEMLNILKRQRNWIKYLIAILIIFLLWNAYTDKNNILNPVFEKYGEINFSLFTPVSFSNLSLEIILDSESSNRNNSFVYNIKNLYYGLDEGETRVKGIGFLHFNKIPIDYELNSCIGERRNRIVQAFNIIESETGGILLFKEKSPGKLVVNCLPQLETEHASGYGGPEYYLGSNEIIRGSVDLYAHDSKFSRCESYPVTEIHEILHALGFDHLFNEDSIMYVGDTSPIILNWGESDQPYVCIEIEKDIVNCLKYIYSSGSEEISCQGILFL